MNLNNPAFSCHIPERAEEFRTSSQIARCAQLAMLLEVSASPKPGNVDREHNYPDTCFEHFVASSVAAYPVLELAARSRDGIGTLLMQVKSPENRENKLAVEKQVSGLKPRNLRTLLPTPMLLSGQRAAKTRLSSTGLSGMQE